MTRETLEPFRLTLNGHMCETQIDPRALLIEVVRDLDAKGSRVGCLTGDCGACSLYLDGRLAKACLVLAMSARDSDVVTIEGNDDAIAVSIKDAFIARKGFQCGFCTSGMIMVAADLLRANASPTEADIRTAISGNLCRCTGYEDIVSAIADAAASLRTRVDPEQTLNQGERNIK